MPASALFSFTSLAGQDKDFLQAVHYYQKALRFQNSEITPDKHIALGTLLLKADKKEQVFLEFLAALKKIALLQSI